MSNQRGIYIINTFLNRKFGEEKKKNSKCLLLDLTLNSKEEHCQKCKTDFSIESILECVAPYKHHEHDLFIFKHFTYHSAHSQERVYTSWCMTRSQPAETANMHTFRDFFAGGEGKEER